MSAGGPLRYDRDGRPDQPALAIDLSYELIEAIAERVAEIIGQRQPDNGVSPTWLNTREAAKHLACPPGRIHDLVQLRKLSPRRDGRRLLFRREELDAYLEQGR